MAYVLEANATGQCAHGGTAQPLAGNPRVKINGGAVLTVSSQLAISGCTNQISGSPVPCVLGAFTKAALRVKVMGQPVVLSDSTIINAPTGVATTMSEPQTRVKGL